MQAHPLSNSAAWNIIFALEVSAPTNLPTLMPEGLGFAHDAGNLLGEAGFYALLDVLASRGAPETSPKGAEAW